MKKEYQIVIEKMPDGWEWYTAQYRNVYFLFRWSWKALTPERQVKYEHAMNLINLDISREEFHGLIYLIKKII